MWIGSFSLCALKSGTEASTQARKPFMSHVPRAVELAVALGERERVARPALAFDRHAVAMAGKPDAASCRRRSWRRGSPLPVLGGPASRRRRGCRDSSGRTRSASRFDFALVVSKPTSLRADPHAGEANGLLSQGCSLRVGPRPRSPERSARRISRGLYRLDLAVARSASSRANRSARGRRETLSTARSKAIGLALTVGEPYSATAGGRRSLPPWRVAQNCTAS